MCSYTYTYTCTCTWKVKTSHYLKHTTAVSLCLFVIYVLQLLMLHFPFCWQLCRCFSPCGIFCVYSTGRCFSPCEIFCVYSTSQEICTVVVCWSLQSVHSTRILQDYFTDTEAIFWLPRCQWCNPEEYEQIDHMNKHNKTKHDKTICIFYGMYSTSVQGSILSLYVFSMD